MSKGDAESCPPEQLPKKSSDSSPKKSKEPASQKPSKTHPSPQDLASLKKKQIMENLSKLNTRKFLNLDFLKNLLGNSKEGTAGMGDSAKAVGRAMKFPYTYSAKIAQFPYKFHINNNWLIKYYLIAVVVSAPLFYKIGKASYAPENVRTWNEIRRREFTPGGHH